MNVSSCTVNPSTISIGQGATLTVTLNSPAPAGGVTVPIHTDFNGTQETLVQSPTHFTFNAGASK